MKDTRSDAELNRIIAEWCGWTQLHKASLFRSGICGTDPNGNKGREVPPYSSDLDAMHEALNHLTGDNRSFWYDVLAIECPDDPDADIQQMKWLTNWFVAVEATARQRAEALVAVIEEGRQ